VPPGAPVLAAALMTAAILTGAPQARAQSPFAVAARVNDDIVTNYEIQQRQRFLSLLNAPGEVVAQARETLVNERLQVQAADASASPPRPRRSRKASPPSPARPT
jgi:peptidyl-prolyl cis-trans isomerase SurA